MLIAIEGIDGSGKTTQVNLLAEVLSSNGHKVITSKEPTDGPYGQKLRDSAITGRMSVAEELELFILDRKEHVSQLINPNLEINNTVILDRYYFSTIAYQSVRGLDENEIRTANEAFAPLPAHLFILDVGVDTALERIGIRDGQGNDFEKRENLEACRAIFQKMNGDYVHHIDAEQTPEKVHEQILSFLR